MLINLFLSIVPLLCLEANCVTGYVYLSLHLSSWFQQGSHRIRVSYCLEDILPSIIILPNAVSFVEKALRHQQVLRNSRKQEPCFSY